MSNDILVVAEVFDGKVSDISYEMTGKAKELAGVLGGKVIVAIMGSGISGLAATFASDSTVYVDDPGLAEFNPEAYGKVVEALVAEKAPKVTLFGYTSIGMDLAAWLSAKTGSPCIAFVNDINAAGGAVSASSRVYGGKLAAEVSVGEGSCIMTVLAGAFPADAGRGSTAAEQVASPVDLGSLAIKFVKLIKPAGGDVDITSVDKLVAIGRGIGSEDGIELAQELAEALEAEVAASRPITDAGWLPKTRQVGKSGLSVKPKLYLMMGISGAPEHLEGMKDAELIIAINTDANAPIFDVAHYGATADLYEVAEEMLELLD
ncbi:MAG: electron transfer flavoprotein subunit alpha/FixB family protein [Anaerolineae bacterium]|nr:electron transfer flavoprotein subunit alpha/FixB family protein [Anaerolineae bacterium]